MKEKVYLHYVRILACVAVVAIHATGFVTVGFDQGSHLEWWIQQLVTSAAIWAVPVFMMMSGWLALSVPGNADINTYYKKRLQRVGVPLLFGVVLYWLFYHWYRHDSIQVTDLLIRVALGPYDHLYFLVALLELALLTPFLKKLVDSLDIKQGLVLTAIFLYIAVFWKQSRLVLTYFIPYLGYYLWGYYLSKISHSKKVSPFIPWLVIGCWVSILGGTVLYVSLVEGAVAYNSPWYRHTNPVVMLLSSAIFYGFSHYRMFFKKLMNVEKVRMISQLTLDIYILHPLVQIGIFHLITRLSGEDQLHWYQLLELIPLSFLGTWLLAVSCHRVIGHLKGNSYLTL